MPNFFNSGPSKCKKKIDNIYIFCLQTDTDGLPTLKSIAQEATNRAGLKVPLSQASTQQTQMSVPGSTAPSISQSGKSLHHIFPLLDFC